MYSNSTGKALADRSKAPELAFALSLIPITSLMTVNLVRDPCAVVVSWAKRIEEDGLTCDGRGSRPLVQDYWLYLLATRYRSKKAYYRSMSYPQEGKYCGLP